MVRFTPPISFLDLSGPFAELPYIFKLFNLKTAACLFKPDMAQNESYSRLPQNLYE
jgi:hypothetical protein